MKILAPDGAPLTTPSVVSIGMFDGVHRGHRSLLAQLRAQADQRGLASVVLTFDPHPRAVLAPDRAPLMISSIAERLELLRATAVVDHVLVLPFDRARSAESAEDFVRETLLSRLRMRALVVGKNFACGRGRTGNVTELSRLGMLHGFEVLAAALHEAPGHRAIGPCSSTATRRLILDGEVEAAALLLQRPHEVSATVTAATPLAWIDAALPPGRCAPPPGAYVGAVRLQQSAAGWRNALLHVDEVRATGRRTVRVRGNLEAGAGDSVHLRFLDRAVVPPQACAAW